MIIEESENAGESSNALLASTNRQKVDAQAQIEAMATRVSKTALMRAIYMEELPSPHKLKSFTMKFLIPESFLSFYLILCLVLVNDEADTSGPVNYKNAVAAFVFLCNIPFMALRIIALLCCKSLRTIPCQVICIWLFNLVAYASWSLFAMYELIFEQGDRSKQGFSIEFFNMVLLTVIFSMSICSVLCATPFFFYKIY